MSIKGTLGAACLLALAATGAFAGDAKEGSSARAPKPADPMAAMKADMAKCDVCKYMAPHLDELTPAMTTEVVKLNDGVAIMHHVGGEKHLATFRAANAEMHKAGDECMTMTDEQAKTNLCAYCQEVRGVVKAGGTMSMGDTENGDMMVLTSSDPAVRKRIDNIASMCEMMSGS